MYLYCTTTVPIQQEKKDKNRTLSEKKTHRRCVHLTLFLQQVHQTKRKLQESMQKQNSRTASESKKRKCQKKGDLLWQPTATY